MFKIPEEKLCDYCGNVYDSYRAGQKYCTRNCKQLAKQSRDLAAERLRREELGIEGNKVKEPKARAHYKNYEKIILRSKERYYREMFGLSLEEAMQRKRVQIKCDCCNTSDPGTRDGWFVIDHCHDSGEIRGLLCNTCNTFAGIVEKQNDRLELIRVYLLKFLSGQKSD